MRTIPIFFFFEEDFRMMFKRIFALLLCLLMLIPCLASCATKNEDDKGAYITMYLTDEIYDFDPANAYLNSDAANVISLLFDTLFTLDANGNLQKSLAKDYRIVENAEENLYTMEITLNSTSWSNGTKLSADDVVYAWKRLLNVNNSFEAAALLFDIKNARAVKQGDESIDNLGLEALESDVVKITFEGKIDYNQFLLNLTNVATAPLPETYVYKDADWAKKSSTMITSGAFKLGKISYKDVLGEDGLNVKAQDNYELDEYGERLDELYRNYNVKIIDYFYLERNSYYYRDVKRDSIDSAVTPYRILVNCSMTDEEILAAYKEGKIFYIGDIPYSLRNDEYVKQYAKVSDALSTFVCYLNENAIIDDGADGMQLFAYKEVRKALSLAIDRTAIANAIVYAEAATGLVSNGVLNAGTGSGSFRSAAGDALLNTSPNETEAKNLLSSVLSNAAVTDPSKYSFTIKVAAHDEENIVMATMIAEAWKNVLDLNVTVEEMTTIQNNDTLKALAGSDYEKPSDVCDDLLLQAVVNGEYEVVACDYAAFSADAYSMLANFAKPFSGMAIDMDSETYELVAHRTGYDNEKYNNLMEAIFYIPYFASLDYENGYGFLGIYETKEDFQAVYNTVKQVYETYGITPTNNSSEWTKQKETLLHKAEEMLIGDMPVIPVVFNKNAVLVSDQLSKVDSTYYVPSTFRKTALKDYENYYYTIVTLDADGNIVSEKMISIFDDFPKNIEWDKMGQVFEQSGF